MEDIIKTQEKITKKLEELTSQKEKLSKDLETLKSQFEVGRRNLDAIEGALFILNELNTKVETEGVVSEDEASKESKH